MLAIIQITMHKFHKQGVNVSPFSLFTHRYYLLVDSTNGKMGKWKSPRVPSQQDIQISSIYIGNFPRGRKNEHVQFSSCNSMISKIDDSTKTEINRGNFPKQKASLIISLLLTPTKNKKENFSFLVISIDF